MKEQDKKEIRQIFNEGINDLIIPELDRVYKEITDTRKGLRQEIRETKKELKEDIYDLGNKVDNVDRKLTAEIEWRDIASKRLKKVEVKLGLET